MEARNKVGFWMSLIFGLYGVLGAFYVFVISNHWVEMWDAKAGQYSEELGMHRLDEVFIVKYLTPALHDLAVVGAVIMIAAAYMFYKKNSKAWHVGVAGSIIAIQGTGFLIVAAASAGIFPEYVFLFIPNLLAFFLYIAVVRKFPAKAILFSFLVGMTYVLALFNGIASASRMSQREYLQGIPGLAADTPMFGSVQQVNWIGMIAWGIFLVAFLFRKKWIIPLGIFAAILNIVGGLPLGLDSMSEGTTFSMFLIAPIFSLIILVYILSPAGERLITSDWDK